jgi:hypothetical protein
MPKQDTFSLHDTLPQKEGVLVASPVERKRVKQKDDPVGKRARLGVAS